MELVYTVYCHTHTESGRRYIGLTKLTMMQRWNQHVQNAKAKRGKGCHYFWAAIRKYGKDAFEPLILQRCSTLEIANAYEDYYIDLFRTRDPECGFNLAKGGEHKPHPVRKNPWDDPEYRAKHANDILRCLTPEARSKMIATRNSPAVFARASADWKARWKDPSFRERAVAASRATWADETRRAKSSSTFKARWQDPELHKRASDAIKLKWTDPVYRAKVSAALKANRDKRANKRIMDDASKEM